MQSSHQAKPVCTRQRVGTFDRVRSTRQYAIATSSEKRRGLENASEHDEGARRVGRDGAPEDTDGPGTAVPRNANRHRAKQANTIQINRLSVAYSQ